MAAAMSGAGGFGDTVNPLRTSRLGQDESEFQFLFFEHYERILRVLMRLLGNRAQAEELANEVFWRLSRQSASWLISNDVGPWLYRTAINAGIDSLRASNNRARYENAAMRETIRDSSGENPLEDLLRNENRLRVQNVLSAMKPARAQLLLMRSCDCSYKELADLLGVSIGSVGTLLNRSEEEFRKKYLAVMAKEEAK